MKKNIKNTTKTVKNTKPTKKCDLKGVKIPRKVAVTFCSSKPAKVVHKRTDEVDFSKNFKKMTKRELCENLYYTKRKLGEDLIPIGRKTSLTKQEFVKRYVNGVGGTNGFKKSELIELNEIYVSKLGRGYGRKK